VNPDSLSKPWGFSHAVVAVPGRTIYVAGQTGHRRDDSIAEGLVDQFDDACANVVEALRGAGAGPEDLVSMQIFTTDLHAYLGAAHDIGERYRTRLGRHFPAMALVEVKGLVGGAMVEIMCIAVVPERSAT
jgi:enamine deaminase RidA (YjgF/YER057c/UK114 family)